MSANESELEEINAAIDAAETGSVVQRLREAEKQLKICQEKVDHAGHEKDLGTAEMLARNVANEQAAEDGDAA